jgi:chromosome segregation ATPase
MQLPAFITRAVSFFDKAELNLTAASELQNLRSRQAELEKELATAKTDAVTKDGKITELQAALEKAQGEVNANGTEIAALKLSLEAEKERTTETLASMGIDPAKIPVKAADKKPAGETKIIEQYEAIKNPVERTAFYRKNQEAFDAAWKAAHPDEPAR